MRPKEERIEVIDGEGYRTVIFRVTPRTEVRTDAGSEVREGTPAYLTQSGEKLLEREDGFTAIHTRKRYRLFDPKRDAI